MCSLCGSITHFNNIYNVIHYGITKIYLNNLIDVVTNHILKELSKKIDDHIEPLYFKCDHNVVNMRLQVKLRLH